MKRCLQVGIDRNLDLELGSRQDPRWLVFLRLLEGNSFICQNNWLCFPKMSLPEDQLFRSGSLVYLRIRKDLPGTGILIIIWVYAFFYIGVIVIFVG